MPLQKNQILTLRIERLSSDGSGVAHSADGEAVFVPGTAPGDEARVRIVKDCGRYAFGILDELLTPSPDRIPVDCPVAGPCGGCSLRHLDYAAELRAKQESVLDAFRRIGGLEVPVLDILPSPDVDRYRNKVQFPVGIDKNGVPCIGFYAGRTHRIVPCPDCKLQPSVLNEIGNALCAFFAQQGIRPYDEQSGKGLVRHIFLRRGAHSGQIMVCLVCTRAKLPHAEQLCTALRGQFPAISTILLNVNAKNTNVILGSENHILYGPGYIEDTLCGVPVRLGPLSFYQVNTLAAERLYGVAAQYAQLSPDDTLLDLYCGMGTIGLSMAEQCRELIGVEIVPEAIESAKANAARMGEAVAAKSRFFCADAGQAATQLAAEGLHPDIVMLDPPRKGCDEATLSAVVRMAPRRVVYVSCNPATAARDAAWLEKNGYHTEKVQPVDLFPRTKHCETVVLLSKGEVDSKKIRVEFSLEDMDMSEFQDGATYTQIKDYVLEHSGLKVSNLYISQIKRKCGIEVGKNYNLPKSEDSRQPMCPPEKEKAIREAFKYFGMI
ncbi:23S rRNA (uracil(1939)-C(5))-methyltransferase RlmD [Faecalibacterium prausnitzii]|uniref:23S rRNA (uracil(1939)-C(5))-methyltransferase RlmD n=1 Tax=Faecalibacterium prausnitzii TaxID=853 RepID=UPI0022E11773|nr:23S rRNA (uracil(1939)-C(5))-methyltransferase RlmD [Faecalibacterium prausnitzii]